MKTVKIIIAATKDSDGNIDIQTKGASQFSEVEILHIYKFTLKARDVLTEICQSVRPEPKQP